MGYLSIDNLYKPQAQLILHFKQLYALEKIHGTSAHLSWAGDHLAFFSGGEPHKKFVALFDVEKLEAIFREKFSNLSFVTIFGEAYGGKQQGMSGTYGKDLKFIAFDVKIWDNWLSVPQADDLCKSLGIEFVDYKLVSSDIETLNTERDKPSTQAARNGITEPRLREGVVLRPPFECHTNYGDRLIVKYKGDVFSERERPVHREDFDPTSPRAVEMLAAEAIANEWATPMRLEHVIDHIIRERENKSIGMEDTKAVIHEMVEDIKKEWEGGEDAAKAAITPRVSKVIGTVTAKLLKLRLQKGLEDGQV